MRFNLFDIENLLSKDLLSDGEEVLRTTQEFDISNPETGNYHCISRHPDYHVEIKIKDDGSANAKCHCQVFKKSFKCKHAVAAMFLLRDHLKRDRRTQRKSNQEILDEVFSKLNVRELKSFFTTYAMSHSILRAEILSNYLYLTKKPNYHHLFQDLAPVDKYGHFRLNRNNIKTVRSVSATLLKRAQQLLQDRSLSEALLILEAVLTHLHRLWAKAPQYQDQLMVELKHAYRVFEMHCTQQMAPRLHERTTTLSIDVCNRESYIFPPGMRPLIEVCEDFFLEEKQRKEAFSIVLHKIAKGSFQVLKWITLAYRWMHKWNYNVQDLVLKSTMEKVLPDSVRELSTAGYHEDVLFVMRIADRKKYDSHGNQSMLQYGFKAARITGNVDSINKYANELALHYLSEDAWEALYEQDKKSALHLLNIVEDYYVPDDRNANNFLLNAWKVTGDGMSLIKKLKSTSEVEELMKYDLYLKEKFRIELVDLYIERIRYIRDNYGGVVARQKLNNIFNHLKSIDLFQSVADKAKEMEKLKENEHQLSNGTIKGFVFDLDGVIVDTAVHHFAAWKKILKELGADLTDADDHQIRGAGRMESLEYLIQTYGIELSEGQKQFWAQRKNEIYLESIESITPADMLPGAAQFIENSRQLNLLIGLGSASKNARSVLSKLHITDKFDVIIDGNDAKASKPDPEVFLKACNALGLLPEHVVVFEDASKGVEAAISAGCKVVGIGNVSTLAAAHHVIPGLGNSTPVKIIEALA